MPLWILINTIGSISVCGDSSARYASRPATTNASPPLQYRSSTSLRGSASSCATGLAASASIAAAAKIDAYSPRS